LSWTWTPPWCGRPSTSTLSPWPSPSPCWSSPLFLINNTCIEPSVSSEKQLTKLERTWRSNCRARALVIGPCIVCKGEMSSSPVPYAFAAPEQYNSLAYVIYKVGGGPADYQFFSEPPQGGTAWICLCIYTRWW
jgi:hypothetical protein